VLVDGVTPWDRGRHLFLREGDGVWRYRTDSRDFPDVEIERTKGLGQVYFDVSGRDALDDFARDLAKLERSSLCLGCREADVCAGMFQRSPVDVFRRDDDRLREVVAGLRGDVLDVGCGEGRYDDVLAPLGTAGVVRYVALEPDEARLQALAKKWPWARLRHAEAESLDAEASFDHVLVLRSWNHLREPERVLLAIARALRPGGTLTLADDVAFGHLRDREHAERAERGAAVFEHRRNDDASDVERILTEKTSFEVFDRVDVGPGTSTLWVLRCRAPLGASSSNPRRAE
jgi:SAM-dependent methyltransferase